MALKHPQLSLPLAHPVATDDHDYAMGYTPEGDHGWFASDDLRVTIVKRNAEGDCLEKVDEIKLLARRNQADILHRRQALILTAWMVVSAKASKTASETRRKKHPIAMKTILAIGDYTPRGKIRITLVASEDLATPRRR